MLKIIYGLCDEPRVRYVGQTKNGLQSRLRSHINSAGTKPPGGKANPSTQWLRKRRQQGIKIDARILCEIDSGDDDVDMMLLDWAEIHLISHYRSLGEADLNVTDGGQGQGSHGHPQPEAAKLLISKKNSGENNGMFGKIPANKGKPFPDELKPNLALKCGKPVVCLNDGKTYPSAVAAAKAYGINRNTVGQLCHKRHEKSIAGLRFQFV